MPAVTPAEVATLPSRTKIGSGSTVTVGEHPGEELAARPVGGGAAAVEQPGLRERECARAHRGHPAGLARDPTDGRDGLGVEHQLADTFSPGDDERVHRATHVGDGGVDGDPQAARGPDGGRGRAGQLEGVPRPGTEPGRRREDLGRPADVEGLGAVVREDHDPAGRGRSAHGPILREPPSVCNALSPTIPAIRDRVGLRETRSL